MHHTAVDLKTAAIDAIATGPEDTMKDIGAETEIVVADRSTDSRTGKASRLIVLPWRRVTVKVLFENIVLEEVPSAGRARDVLSRTTGTGLHIAVAFAHR